MSVAPGSRLGSYEIVAPLGAGGMGEVYRARDTRLNRDVAIKTLPELFVLDPDRLARFTREAQVLAALNHPNIAAIYGVVDLPSEAGSHGALVMELVDGEDLSAIIARGPMPIADVLSIARQMADGLEAAHEQGIVHRDLKPGNIKVRSDGTVKVLDFGLARGLDPAVTSSADAMRSPTLTARATQIGVVLGTAAYMAPEQARGKVVDRRADIWSFGVILYEMLTGQRAFKGDDISETLASVLKDTPSLDALPASTPPALRRLVGRCLERDVKMRLRDIGEARIALESTTGSEAAPVRRPAPRPLVWAVVALAAMTAASVALAAFVVWNRPQAVQSPSVRFTIQLPPGEEITSYPAITRDGRTVAYVTERGSNDVRLYLRDLNAFEPREVPGSSGARQPFFSPDGKWIAFFARGQLQKAEVNGGTPVHVAEATYPFGGTWNDDDTIIYAASLGSGLLRVRASGGSPEQLTRPDGAAQGYAHVFPQAMPGGQGVLFTMWGQTPGARLLSLPSGQSEPVMPADSFTAATFQAINGPRGRLLISDSSAGIRAAPFDVDHPALTSADRSVLANVNFEVETESRSWLAVSNTGTAVYATGNPAHASLVWVDRAGKIEPIGGEQDQYREVSISPDGVKAAVRQGLDIWIHDLQRGTRTRLTSATGSNIMPLWTRDGTRIVFASNRGGDWDIYTQPADGVRPAEALLKRPQDQFPLALAADDTLLYTEIGAKTGRDLWTLAPDGKPSPMRVTPSNETAGQFSPGPAGGPRWLAYSSDESGRNEIYVQSYPSGANRIAVSTSGGSLPMWSPDGKELFYVTGDSVVAVARQSDGSFGAPHQLFDRSTLLFNHRFHSYGVALDGKRFLMVRRDPAAVPRQLNVILNWADEIGRP